MAEQATTTGKMVLIMHVIYAYYYRLRLLRSHIIKVSNFISNLKCWCHKFTMMYTMVKMFIIIHIIVTVYLNVVQSEISCV